MRLYVGITDRDWYRTLSERPGIEEVNFWQPGGRNQFQALAPGDLFLFKFHAPDRRIAGGGVFAHATRLPASLAWEAFGHKNGAGTLREMRTRIEKYRRTAPDPHEDYVIGCILLEQPFFLPPEAWIPEPHDWHPNIVQGKTYDAREEVGRELWSAVSRAMATGSAVEPVAAHPPLAAQPFAVRERWGEPIVVRPRLGQGSFRIVVTDAYERRCAVTRERTLPALEAAHIRPYSDDGEHRVDNGILLRRDLHALFDRGYVTVTLDHKLEVSGRIRQDFENGRDYYAMHGKDVWVPNALDQKPAAEFLRWHNEERWLG